MIRKWSRGVRVVGIRYSCDGIFCIMDVLGLVFGDLKIFKKYIIF